MRYFVKVFGCQMNHSDAERISAFLNKYKIKQAASADEADLVIFVTCGVRQSAEDRVYGLINNIQKKYPDKKIILTGCLAHRKDVQRRLKNKVNLYFPISDFQTFENWIIENCLKIENLKLKIPAQDNCRSGIDYLSIKPKYSGIYSAYVPVMTGCNNFCAYCVVPYARGREYSRPAEDILREVKSLVKKGYKEIMLLGQNVNSYLDFLPSDEGRCPKDRGVLRVQQTEATPPPAPSSPEEGRISGVDFPKLLQLIEKIPGKFWLIFLTSHPKDMSDELIETIAKSKKICEYISLPAQAGDNEIIRKMNRKYTIEHYKDLIKKIRTAYGRQEPGSCQLARAGFLPTISTDIIVGFPGETKKQFENTENLLKEMKFDMAYIAQYSPRPETTAWKLKDNVSKKEKARREKVLTEILKKTALANNKKYINEIVEVLVDKYIDPSTKKYLAHTRTQKRIIFYSKKKSLIGQFAKVKIVKAKAFGLEGEII
ncbi:MAG TPA: MiaB/RimO family radical SAM methylthiotransferase [Candidatus Bathyarchaeia archaeon]|nr:MiaB/RimO family radical SAM methylthiotransferase [Candidatus Bathyarchaeia archaeon]